MFPKDSLVKVLNHKSFKKAMKANETSLVAFVAPWCGHCQKMVPEYSKAALGLYPLVPAYAVNCDAEKNKRLCSEQGVQGFPTVKLFPRGNSMPPVLYNEERTSTGFFYFATRGIPNAVEKFYYVHQIPGWISEKKHKYRALLMTKDKRVPLLWRVLANKYSGTDILFGTHRDKNGKSSIEMGFEAGEKKEAKVLLYPIGSTTPVRYHGVHKHDSLSKFFDSVLDGTADLSEVVEKTKEEKYVEDPEEAEIAKKQEAQRIALMHGGFTDIIDFEKAILAGGANYHDTNGYGGMMGGIPESLKKEKVPEASSTSAGSAFVTDHPAMTTTIAPGVSDTPESISATPQPTKVVVEHQQVVLEAPEVTKAAGGGQCAPPSERAGEKSESNCQAPGDRPKDEL
jgi:protein disulfide-isomerase A6